MYLMDLLQLSLLLSAIGGCWCWNQEQLDLFDLVENIGQNFYEILQVEESASSAEIRRAFRQLSLHLHPDKNTDPEAAEHFRKLVAVAEVLRNEQKRFWYDNILRDGLPDWKQPVYYYRRVRKMAFVELFLLLFVLICIGHYIIGWAVYFERQLELQDALDRKERREKRSKQSKLKQQWLEAEVEYRTAKVHASVPQLKNILPLILARQLFKLALFCWRWYRQWRERKKTQNDVVIVASVSWESSRQSKRKMRQDRESETIETETPVCDGSQIRISPRTYRGTKKRRHQDGGTTKDQTEMNTYRQSNGHVRTTNKQQCGHKAVPSREERDRKFSEEADVKATMYLQIELSKKHSAGESDLLETTVSVKRRINNDGCKTVGNNESAADLDCEEDVESSSSPTTTWTQYQQRQLEWAIGHYPKYSKDRWDNISKAVPGKSKVECIERCRELFEILKRRKQIS